jgi:hypothetical protein
MIESLTSFFGASFIVSPSLKDFLGYFPKALPQLPLQMSQNKKCENALDKINFYINIIRNESVMILVFMAIKLDFALLWLWRECGFLVKQKKNNESIRIVVG